MTTAVSQPQHLQALARGNAIKAQMADLCRSLDTGNAHESYQLAAGHLEKPDETTARISLGRFLTAIYRVGNSRAHEFLNKAGLSSRMLTRRIGPLDPVKDRRTHRVLTERQRRELARVLREAAE